MVDKVVIQKIVNGYVTQNDWYSINTQNTVHHKDFNEVIKHLETCFKGQ